MLQDITLLIPTYNRHRYLNRILEYYSGTSIKILIADSSHLPYANYEQFDNIEYIHLPGENLPQKIAKTLRRVTTEFVVMCADDDFLVPEGIIKCIELLKLNSEFISAQGNCINYYSSPNSEEIIFSAMYDTQLSYQISQNDSFERAEELFKKYRSLFYSVNYTENLKIVYEETIQINNLYLNEYLSGIVLMMIGKHVELPVFYQVREYAATSDDKITDNLDIISNKDEYQQEYRYCLNYIAEIGSKILGYPKDFVLNKVKIIFSDFSKSLIWNQTKKSIPFKKKIGKIIAQVPIIGKQIILKNREIEKKLTLSMVIKDENDKTNLKKIENLIKKYAQAISQ